MEQIVVDKIQMILEIHLLFLRPSISYLIKPPTVGRFGYCHLAKTKYSEAKITLPLFRVCFPSASPPNFFLLTAYSPFEAFASIFSGQFSPSLFFSLNQIKPYSTARGLIRTLFFYASPLRLYASRQFYRNYITRWLISTAPLISLQASNSGDLVKGGVVTEGSVGNTAISLATVAPAYGCKCHFVIPDDIAIEKSQIIEALGATLEKVRPVSITHKDHFVNVARRRASEANKLAAKLEEDNESKSNSKGGFFEDQFENLANFRAHYKDTGPEIWDQTSGKLDAFIAGAGTGGTLAGVSNFLKEKNPNIKCFLADPPGSGLFNKVTRGVMCTKEEAEGKRLKNPFDTITEGVGINRLTKNFAMAEVDGAYRVTDKESAEMSMYLLKNDGLFLGSSSAVNCVGAVRLACDLGPGHMIVTILCDSGMRRLSKFYSNEYLDALGLVPSATALEFLDH